MLFDGVGMLLLLAAAHESGLITALAAALPCSGSPWLRRLLPLTRLQLLLTLLFLCAVGLARTWDLRGYTGKALACVTGRLVAYGYRSAERFLSQLARADADGPLTDALACWTDQLWSPWRDAVPLTPDHLLPAPVDDPFEPPVPSRTVVYVDSHRKPLFSDVLLPRGLIGRTGKVLGARTLVFLHDAHGHVLLVQTARGDAHLTHETPRLLEQYAHATGQKLQASVVIDREGMSASFLLRLLLSGHSVITCLRSDQYAGEESFTQIGAFEPLTLARDGTVVREVAEARYQLRLPECEGEALTLQVALIRDWSRMQPIAPDEAVAWDADLEGEAGMWWAEDWEATPAPALELAPRLFPIVSTDLTLTKETLVQLYRGRWPCQENVFKSFLLPLQLDINHGYRKAPTLNTEEAKQQAELNARDQALEQRIAGARKRQQAALARQQRAQQAQQAEQATALEDQAAVDEERWLRQHSRQQRAGSAVACEQQKLEGYCQEQRNVRRQLADLEAQARPMYELDQRKDQIMSVMKVALCNLAMYVRDQYFPVSYARATWSRLRPFFQLRGSIEREADYIRVKLHPFNDRELNRDLQELCAKVAARPPRLPDGRRLIFEIHPKHRPGSNQQMRS
jgi:hypothetical protein